MPRADSIRPPTTLHIPRRHIADCVPRVLRIEAEVAETSCGGMSHDQHHHQQSEASRGNSGNYYAPTPNYTIPSVKAASTVPVVTMQNPPSPTRMQRWAARATDSQFNAMAGAVGGFTSGIVTCPLDVIKTKLQAQGGLLHADKGGGSSAKVYNGLFGTGRIIWREEGIRGMYRGLGPIVLGYLPTWAVWFTVYNEAKVVASQYHSEFPVCQTASDAL